MKQIFWCSFQIAVFGATLWVFSLDEVKGDYGPYGVGFVALIVTMAATALVMILRDSFLFVAGRVRRALSKPDQANDGAGRIDAAPRLSQSSELPPRRWIGKQPG